MQHANGKVILLGEHAVVYGEAALAASLPFGAKATVAPAPSHRVVVDGEARAEPELARALDELCAFFDAPPVEAQFELALPAGFGLGASAAMGVAAARAIAEMVGDRGGDPRVLQAAASWEGVFHGTPSGIDTAAACSRGCFRYRRDTGASPVALGCELPLAIGLVGPRSSTKDMVEGVARLRERRRSLFDKALEGIRSLVRNAELCLTFGDLAGLGKLMDYNQMLLSSLFVSTPPIESACQAAREAGALGAKLTGAGGGGAVLAVAPEPERVLARWQQEGIEGLSCVIAPCQPHPTAGRQR